MLHHTPFPTADALTVTTNRNVTAPSWSVRQLHHIVYPHNFMIAQEIDISYGYKF